MNMITEPKGPDRTCCTQTHNCIQSGPSCITRQPWEVGAIPSPCSAHPSDTLELSRFMLRFVTKGLQHSTKACKHKSHSSSGSHLLCFQVPSLPALLSLLFPSCCSSEQSTWKMHCGFQYKGWAQPHGCQHGTHVPSSPCTGRLQTAIMANG